MDESYGLWLWFHSSDEERVRLGVLIALSFVGMFVYLALDLSGSE